MMTGSALMLGKTGGPGTDKDQSILYDYTIAALDKGNIVCRSKPSLPYNLKFKL